MKVEAVQSFPQPHDLPSYIHFLYILASCYHQFIPGFSKLANPLYMCTYVKEYWLFLGSSSRRSLSTFETTFNSFDQEFILETDASGA